MKEIKFETSERYKGIALWVVIDGQRQNIWDLPKRSATPQVLDAITWAFKLGMEKGLQEAASVATNINPKVDREWQHAGKS